MSKKMYMYLLIFCGILCQGIIATLSDEDTRKSSDSLVRKRRVINHLPGGLVRVSIRDANYIVTIHENNAPNCAGVILSHYNVLTAARCVILRLRNYTILSGSGNERRSNRHIVTSKIENYGDGPHQVLDGIALITVNPPFVYDRKTGYIPLYVGPLPAGTEVTVFGWGCTYSPHPQLEIERGLRSINLPIMNHEECQNIYRNITTAYVIKEKHICTYHPEQYCARNDAGAPLIFQNMLAGIHVWKGQFQGRLNPDVFIDLQHANFRAWIREHTSHISTRSDDVKYSK